MEELAAACEREAKLRRRVYPRWISQGRMTQAKADHEIAAMDGAAAELRKLAEAGRLI